MQKKIYSERMDEPVYNWGTRWSMEARKHEVRDGIAVIIAIVACVALFISVGYFAFCLSHPEEADAVEYESTRDVFNAVKDAMEIRNVDGDESVRWECLADIQAVKAEKAAAEAELLAWQQETWYEPEYYPVYEDYAPSYSSGYSNNFMRDGVVYSEDGTRYTWYSSNVLYHYRTPEWTPDDEGFYRDSDGYYVVASDDYDEGAVVSTPWGEGKVYDGGCDSGTIDMYTAF